MTDFGDASALVIRELTGDKRVLRFTGRGLPYRPLEFTTEQRLNVTHNPGNPVGSSTILGPTYGGTVLNGMWKEKFVLFSSAGSGVAPPITINDEAFISISNIVDMVDDFVEVGQLLEVTWDTRIRHGFLRKLRQTWQTTKDVAFSMEFEWISKGKRVDPAVFVTLAGFDDVAAGIKQKLDALDALDTPEGFGLDFGFIDSIQAFRNAMEDAVFAVLDGVQQFTSKVTTFMRATRGIAAGFQDIASLCEEMLLNIEQQFGEAAGLNTGPSSAGGGGIYADQPYATQTEAQKVQAEVFKLDLKEAINGFRYFVVESRDKLTDALDGDILAVTRPKGGQDLYDIAKEFYGSPFEWRRIAAFNDMTTPELLLSDVVFVPKMNPQQAGTACPGT